MAILEKVEKKELSLADVKNLMNLTMQEMANDPRMSTDTYAACRHAVKPEKQTECVNHEAFVLSFFRKYVERLSQIDLHTLQDEKLRKDIETIKNSAALQNPENMQALFQNPEFQSLNYKGIFPQENDPHSRFIHVNSSYLNNFVQESIECRLYLSPKMENIIEIAKLLVSKHNEQNLPCYFKINKDSKDNDRIVLYSSIENGDAHLQILETIRKEKPQLFEDMNKNPLWADISGHKDIHFGMEPTSNNSGASYGSLRAAAFMNALTTVPIAESEQELPSGEKYMHKENVHTYLLEYNGVPAITDETVRKVQKLFRMNCIELNIDPDNIALNSGDGQKRGYKENNGDHEHTYMTLPDKNGDDYPIWLGNINGDTMQVSLQKAYTETSIMIPCDDLEMLYKWQNGENSPAIDELRGRLSTEMAKAESQQNKEKFFDKINQTLNPRERFRRKMMSHQKTYRLNDDGSHEVRVALSPGGYRDDGSVYDGISMNRILYAILPRKISQLYAYLKLRGEKALKSVIDNDGTSFYGEVVDSILTHDEIQIKAVESQVSAQYEQGEPLTEAGIKQAYENLSVNKAKDPERDISDW
jgi:hypothetical protein